MAIHLAEEYQKRVAERFSASSFTDGSAGKDYSFVGAKTIRIMSVDTVPTVDYNRSGTSRFGDIAELGDTVQELSLSRDRAFTFSIDAGNAGQQFNIKQANACLKRQIDEVVTPEVDAYRFAKWASGNGLSAGVSVMSSVDGELTKDNIIETVLTAGAKMSDELVPAVNRTLYIPELVFIKFRLSDTVNALDAIGSENIKNGYKGTINGMRVVTVPSSIFPANVNFMIKYKGATVDPFTMKNFRVQKNPLGIDGDVVEGHYIYDSFVLDSKAKGIYVSKVSADAVG